MDKCYMEDHTMDDYFLMVQNNIDRTGLHITGVMSDPSFAYTIGLFPVVGFEVLVSGLPLKYVEDILNPVAAAAKERSLKLDVLDNRFTNLPVVFKYCGVKAQEDNGVSRRYYGKDCILMVQMVMCDRAGKFPWEDGFDHAYMDVRQLRYWKE